MLKCTIKNEQIETLRSGDTFVSYEIETESDLPVFEDKKFSVRRRYKDFEMLHNILSHDYNGYAIPPLPRKYTVSSFSGGSLSPIFIARRMQSLQTFLDRCSTHPVISNSMHMYQFLENNSWKSYYHNAWMQSENTKSKGNNVSGGIESSIQNLDPYAQSLYETAKQLLQNADTDLSKLEKTCVQYMNSVQNFPTDIPVPSNLSISNLDVVSVEFKRLKRNSIFLINSFHSKVITSIQDLEDYMVVFKSLIKSREQKVKQFEHFQQIVQSNSNNPDQSSRSDPNFVEATPVVQQTPELKPSPNTTIRTSSLFSIPKFLKKKRYSLGQDDANPMELLQLSFQELCIFNEKLEQELNFLRERIDVEMRKTLQMVCDCHVEYFSGILEQHAVKE